MSYNNGSLRMQRLCMKCKTRKPVAGGKCYAVAGKFICKECRSDKNEVSKAPIQAAV